jgi:NAD(P)H-dependent FMN reductase
MSGPPRVLVVVGSTREGRIGRAVADWFAAAAAAAGGLELDLIDLRDAGLPERLTAGHPSRGEYPDAVRPFAARVATADGVVLVTPEYNHGYPAPLKNALDSVGPEWAAKPVGFVSYGGISGGIRAVEQLRQVVVELHMAPLRDAVTIPRARRLFEEPGGPADPDGRLSDSFAALVRRMSWWARALRAARAAEAYRR